MAKGQTAGDRFYELFRESVIIQSTVTVMVIGAMCTMWLREMEIPEAATFLAGIIMGYWFKTKDRYAQQKRDELLSEPQ